MTKVLVVCSNGPARDALTPLLKKHDRLAVVGSAFNADDALRLTKELKPDVVAVDLQPPGKSGLDAVSRIMQHCPTPVVAIVGEDAGETEASFLAMEAGALMQARRPPNPSHPKFREMSLALVNTLKAMAEVRVVRRWSRSAPTRNSVASTTADRKRPQLVVIGGSTGAPAVLRDIFTLLPRSFALPIVIVQHMTPGFVGAFAEWLASASGFPVSMATDGKKLCGGHAYLAPDGLQLGITRELTVRLQVAPPEHGMCPSVSHLFRSVHEDLRCGTVAALLTGMGRDGARELKALKDGGALTIVQDRASSVVYGMPGEALKQDAATLILPPGEIARAITGFAEGTLPRFATLSAGGEHE